MIPASSSLHGGQSRPPYPGAAAAIRVVLADDHELVRAGIGALLSALPGIAVVGEVRDGGELLRLLPAVEPDVALVDIAMPGMDGLAAIERMGELYPRVRTLVLSMNDSPEVARRALSKGASGYLLKDAAPGEVERALHCVAAGGRYVSASLARRLLQAPPPPEEHLTARQLEILALVARGWSSRDIGARLGLSSKTVDVHRSRLMDKLGIHDVPGLTRYAMRHGLVPVD